MGDDPVAKNALKWDADGYHSDDALFLSVECADDSWVMDSSASFHATHCIEMMKNLRFGNFGKVRLANDEILNVT
ncbi:hypothetical protein E3N88_07151 [Mikania micrantha]|uniref:Uncharacterized protein n=1 Tax=Mikania micrantha TaxID=192012 RepID=A0A5N6PSU1_9ASTR|nr:hypothetical protein E3N88_07151 [Mikania micrantha]